MEATPADTDMAGIENALKGLAGAQALHDLHVWRIGSSMISLTGHLIVDSDTDRDRMLMQAQGLLRSSFGIDHVTLQIETAELHRFLTTEEHTVRLNRKRPPPNYDN
jgi:cobalt-zinc-cadmium efflux system protein